MTFKVKMDDKRIKVDLDSTNVKDILQYCKPKEQFVLVKKFWIIWWKEIPLQRIWKEYGLTRERVRQIENQWLMRFRRLIIGNENYLKVIEEAKKILDINGGFLPEEDLINKLSNKGTFRFSNHELKLILVSDFDLYYLKRNKAINKSFYIDPLYEDLLSEFAAYIVDYFNKKWMPEDLYEFSDKLKNKFYEKHDNIKFIKNNVFYINYFKSVRWISIFDGKVWLESFIDVNPTTIKQKIMYILKRVNKPLHYQEICTKITEWFTNKPVKVNTVHNELVKNWDIFVNMGLGIYGLKEWGFEWGTVKEIIERILNKAWRPISIRDIVKEVLKEKMVSPNTIVLTLQKFKDCFERIDKWVYRIKQ